MFVDFWNSISLIASTLRSLVIKSTTSKPTTSAPRILRVQNNSPCISQARENAAAAVAVAVHRICWR